MSIVEKEPSLYCGHCFNLYPDNPAYMTTIFGEEKCVNCASRLVAEVYHNGSVKYIKDGTVTTKKLEHLEDEHKFNKEKLKQYTEGDV